MPLKINIFFFICFFGNFQHINSQTYLPKSNGEIIAHTYYTLSYVEKHEQAEWVYYMLCPKMLLGTTNRTNNFREDPKIGSGSAQKKDYTYSGLDRGHLAPAGDMILNYSAMSESFYMSNVAPQKPSFNRGIWKALESVVRNWAEKDTIYVVTGGVLVPNLKKIGTNKVSIPNYFYKVIYSPNNNKMIAFVLPNLEGKNHLSHYAVSVNEVEKRTSIDFFPQLSDSIEEQLESKIKISAWDFSRSNTTRSSSKIASTQCIHILTSTNLQCKKRTKNPNGFCYLHQK